MYELFPLYAHRPRPGGGSLPSVIAKLNSPEHSSISFPGQAVNQTRFTSTRSRCRHFRRELLVIFLYMPIKASTNDSRMHHNENELCPFPPATL